MIQLNLSLVKEYTSTTQVLYLSINSQLVFHEIQRLRNKANEFKVI